jgi:CRP-like cAMP-binding protein
VPTQTEDLRRLRSLYNVPEAELKELLPLTQRREYAENEIVFEPGDVCEHALLVLSGRLKVEVDGEGGVRNLGDIWPGEIVGEAALFEAGGTHTVRVRAGMDTRALVITTELVEQARGTRALAAMQRHLMAVLARRVKSTNFAMRKAWQERRAAKAQRPEEAGEADASLSLNDFLRDLLSTELW